MTDFVSNEQIVLAARERLGQGAWNYLAGGSESETTMRRNRLGFDRIAFRPRVLVDVSKIDPSTTFLGQHLRIPVLLAPVGSLQAFDPAGGVAAAKAAARFGTMPVISSVTGPDLGEIAAAADSPKCFQLYVDGDVTWIREIVKRVKDSGYVGFAVTVDVAMFSRRERAMMVGWTMPSGPFRPGDHRNWLASLTWDTLDRIHEMLDVPLMVKGIATAEDAELAVQHGVDVIWVSNHGGRQLDHGRGSIEVLPEIMQAVGGRADVIMDGGVQRGSDVLKAVAMGAKCVAVGKLQALGLGANGEDGVVNMLEILENEIISAMGLLGVTKIDQLGPQYLHPAEAVTPPHEMSGWVNMPGTRLL